MSVAFDFMNVPAYCMQVGRYSIGGNGSVAGRTGAFVLAILGLAATNACGEATAADPVLERGFEHAQTDGALAAKAIISTNLVVGARQMRLVVLRRGNKPPAKTSPGDIPVYLVKAPPTARATPAAVPKGCRCIFVNPEVLDAFVKEQSTGSGRLALNARYVLTFMLLHEVGHLTKSTAGAQFENGELSELNVDPSRAKADEEDADEFATDLVKELIQRKKVSAETLEATTVSMELRKLNWNMQADRTLDRFGALAIGKPEVFFDKNLSHPNLHWRVLRMNNLIQGTRETKALLDTFEDAQRRGAIAQPLYVAPKN